MTLSSRAYAVLLLLLLSVAAVLRLQGLDRLGLWIDEDLTALVARSIRDTGWPLLPSGEAYTRGALFSYLAAGSTALFGDHENALRLPSVLCSLATITVASLYARSLAGPIAGLGAALILACSPWDLHYARMARMYELLALLVVAGVYLVHRGWLDGRPRARLGAALVAGLSAPVHQLGMLFAAVFFLPHLPPAPRRRPEPTGPSPASGGTRRGLIASGLAIATLFLATFLQGRFHAAAKARESAGLSLVVEAGEGGGTLRLPFLPELDLNYSRFLLGDFLATSPFALVAALILLGAAAFVTVRAIRALVGGPGRHAPTEAALLAILAALFLGFLSVNQFVLAAACALVLWLRSGTPRLGLSLALAGVLAALGFLLGQLLAAGPEGLSDRTFLRLFFALPVPFYRLLFVHEPAMVATALVALGLGARQALRQGDDGRFFLASVIFVLLLGMGLFRSPYVIHRYTFYLLPLLVVLYAVAWVDGSRSLARHGRRGMEGAVLGLGLALCGQFAPLEAWRSTHVPYGYGHEQLSDPDLTSHFRYDFRGTAAFLAKEVHPGDLVLSKDSVELRAYGVHSDARLNDLYSVYAFDREQRAMDWYLGVPILHTRAMLEEWLARAGEEGRRVFLAIPDELPDGPAVHLPEDMEALLAELAPGREVYRAPDGVNRVLRIDPPH